MDRASRYLIGIDLGTTNSVVAFLDREIFGKGATPEIRLFRVAQLVVNTPQEASDFLGKIRPFQ